MTRRQRMRRILAAVAATAVLPLGLLAAGVIASAYPRSRRLTEVKVDWLGAGLLFTGVSALLIALSGDSGTAATSWSIAALVLLGAFVVVERRTPEPILPLDLLRTPVIARSLTVVFLVGIALFGAIAFIPLFVQAVRGGTATEAGQAITPLFLGWVVMSIVGARLTVALGYRLVSIAGSVLMTAGFVGLTFVGAESPQWVLLTSCTIIGAGMGTQMLSLLLAVQPQRAFQACLHHRQRAFTVMQTSCITVVMKMWEPRRSITCSLCCAEVVGRVPASHCVFLLPGYAASDMPTCKRLLEQRVASA